MGGWMDWVDEVQAKVLGGGGGGEVGIGGEERI